MRVEHNVRVRWWCGAQETRDRERRWHSTFEAWQSRTGVKDSCRRESISTVAGMSPVKMVAAQRIAC